MPGRRISRRVKRRVSRKVKRRVKSKLNKKRKMRGGSDKPELKLMAEEYCKKKTVRQGSRESPQHAKSCDSDGNCKLDIVDKGSGVAGIDCIPRNKWLKKLWKNKAKIKELQQWKNKDKIKELQQWKNDNPDPQVDPTSLNHA
jgi:hypothetical protein